MNNTGADQTACHNYYSPKKTGFLASRPNRIWVHVHVYAFFEREFLAIQRKLVLHLFSCSTHENCSGYVINNILKSTTSTNDNVCCAE